MALQIITALCADANALPRGVLMPDRQQSRTGHRFVSLDRLLANLPVYMTQAEFCLSQLDHCATSSTAVLARMILT